MKATQWSPSDIRDIDDIWAKSPRNEFEQGESLLHHTDSVIVNAVNGLDSRKEIINKIVGPSEALRFRDLVLAGAVFHDFGKVTMGFQRMLRTGDTSQNFHHALLSWIPVFFGPASKWKPEDAILGSLIVAHHHWRFSSNVFSDCAGPLELPRRDILTKVIKELVARYCHLALSMVEGDSEELIQSRILKEIEVSMTCKNLVNQWRRNLFKMFKEKMPEDEQGKTRLRQKYALAFGILQSADWAASRMDNETMRVEYSDELIIRGISERARIQGRVFRDLYHHQEAARRSSGHLILTAPTGRGKFEAALLWHSVRDGAKMVYLLPVMVLANKLRDRAIMYLDKENAISNSIALLHSSARYHLSRAQEELGIISDISTLISRHRAFGAQITFATVDQALFSVLNSGYWEQTLMNLAGADVVLDEIHSYDPFTLSLILRLIRETTPLGTRFCFMSATMPHALAELLQNAIGDGVLSRVKCRKEDEPPPRVRIEFKKQPLLDCVDDILKCFNKGMKILVVANTIRDAQELYSKVLARSPDIQKSRIRLLHSLFTVDDRVKRESELEKLSYSQQGYILISTQVIEVGIDIDFDILFTEEAPPDALVQRFGRVNRHGIKDPATVVITQISPRGEHVYVDAMQMIKRGRAFLEGHHGVALTERDLCVIVEQCCSEVLRSPKYVSVFRQTDLLVDKIRKDKLLIGESDDWNGIGTRASETPRIAVIPERIWREEWDSIKAIGPEKRYERWKVYGSTVQIPAYWRRNLIEICEFEGYPVLDLEYSPEIGVTRTQTQREENWNIV